jgi:hypothetical protein
MSGKIEGHDYDAEFRNLLRMYKINADNIENFNLDNFIKVTKDT